MFLALIVMVFFGNSICKGINEETTLKIQQLELEHKSLYIDQIDSGNMTDVPKFDEEAGLTLIESTCRQQQAFIG